MYKNKRLIQDQLVSCFVGALERTLKWVLSDLVLSPMLLPSHHVTLGKSRKLSEHHLSKEGIWSHYQEQS